MTASRARRGLTRRARRRLYVFGAVALVAATVPIWVPRLLSAVPAFQVQRVEITGAVYVAPDEIHRLAGIGTDASVWDRPDRWERHVEEHPLILEARIRRTGMRSLEIRVEEDSPVALVAVPELVAVNSGGRRLVLDPAEAGLDLPVLMRPAVLEDGRLVEPDQLELVGLLADLLEYDPAFVERISQIGALEDAVEILMLPDAGAERILLPWPRPRARTLAGLRRIELALGEADPRRAQTADARFAGQVVLSFREGT